MDCSRLIREIEDYLVPRLKLDMGEARLYYHLVRHSRLDEKYDVLISVAQLADVLNCSKNAVKPRLRSLQEKGIIEVTSTGWAGTRIKVFLPAEIPSAVPEEKEIETIDIESVDFYKDPKYRPSIFEREQGRCFYCRRNLTEEDSGLDHAEPQKVNGTNAYRNIVAACYSCNSSKCDDSAEDFLRKLYRRSLLTASELEERLGYLKKLKDGLLRPII